MELSLFIAQVLGPIFIVVGAGMLLNRGFFQQVMEDYTKNSALVFFTGMFPLAFGIVIVLLHNVWAASWVVLITIFGWCGIIKGVWLVLFPKSVHGFLKAYLGKPALLTAHSIVAIALGAFLVVMGYGIL